MYDFRRNMKQAATYWAPGAPDGFGGVVFAAPIILMCRWQETAELFRDKEAREQMSSAVVYVDSAVQLQGYLALGEFTDASPHGIGLEIRQRVVSVNLRGTAQLHKVFL